MSRASLERKLYRRRVPWLTMLLLSACASSPPVKYYDLAAVKGPPIEAASGTPVQIARVHLPPSLDRLQMVRETSSYSLEISDRHRWSGPLDQMIRRSVSEDLLAILPSARVVLPHEPAPPHTLELVIDVVRFMPDAAGRVTLEASWSVVSNGGAVERSAVVNITVPMASASYADQVAAMSQAVARMAERIAHDLG